MQDLLLGAIAGLKTRTYIEIGHMEVVSEEPIGLHIESCTVLPYGCAVRHFLTTEGLQMWLNGNVVTHLR